MRMILAYAANLCYASYKKGMIFHFSTLTIFQGSSLAPSNKSVALYPKVTLRENQVSRV